MILYTVYFFLIFNLITLNCESFEAVPDLIANLVEDGSEVQLEAYKWKENDKYLIENNQKMKWFSLGHPVIVEMKSNNQNGLFHFSSKGFSTHIRLLTHEQKKLIANKATVLYNLEIDAEQIINMPLTSFQCYIYLNDGENETNLLGEVKLFTKFPLRIDFKAPRGSREIEMLNKTISSTANEVEFECEIKSNSIGYSRKFSIYSKKFSPVYSICGIKYSESLNYSQTAISESTFDCNYGGLCSCTNGGECKKNGLCVCTVGYYGNTCSTFIGVGVKESLIDLRNEVSQLREEMKKELTILFNLTKKYREDSNGEIKNINNLINKFTCKDVQTLNDVNCIYQNQSFVFMAKNYVKRHSLTSYGGINWDGLTGFEQVVTNDIERYYAIDHTLSRIVTFNQNWVYQGYQSLPYRYSYTTKYVDGYFYFSSNDYFYKTKANFDVVNYYQNVAAVYRQFAYDPSDSKFYVASYGLSQIDAFDTSCLLLQSIKLDDKPFGLAFYNGNIFVGMGHKNHILLVQNGLIKKNITVEHCQCPTCFWQIISIKIDLFGYLVVTCIHNKIISIYDSNGIYMNAKISTSTYPYIVEMDARGRVVVMQWNSLDIFY